MLDINFLLPVLPHFNSVHKYVTVDSRFIIIYVTSALVWTNVSSLVPSSGLDSDESYEGVSEASFKDAVVFDGRQKKNGAVPQENGIKKHRYDSIPLRCLHKSNPANITGTRCTVTPRLRCDF